MYSSFVNEGRRLPHRLMSTKRRQNKTYAPCFVHHPRSVIFLHSNMVEQLSQQSLYSKSCQNFLLKVRCFSQLKIDALPSTTFPENMKTIVFVGIRKMTFYRFFSLTVSSSFNCHIPSILHARLTSQTADTGGGKRKSVLRQCFYAREHTTYSTLTFTYQCILMILKHILVSQEDNLYLKLVYATNQLKGLCLHTLLLLGLL
jgi:hypothetical protein